MTRSRKTPRTTARVRPWGGGGGGLEPAHMVQGGPAGLHCARAGARRHPQRPLWAPFPRRLLPCENRGPVQWAVPRGAQAGLGPLLHRLALLGHPVSVFPRPPPPTPGSMPAGILPLGMPATMVRAHGSAWCPWPTRVSVLQAQAFRGSQSGEERRALHGDSCR